MLLAMKMERELGKDEIFGLYLNKSFFGNRAYGVAAAAEFYYGKTLAELTLDEAAVLAEANAWAAKVTASVQVQKAQ